MLGEFLINNIPTGVAADIAAALLAFVIEELVRRGWVSYRNIKRAAKVIVKGVEKAGSKVVKLEIEKAMREELGTSSESDPVEEKFRKTIRDMKGNWTRPKKTARRTK